MAQKKEHLLGGKLDSRDSTEIKLKRPFCSLLELIDTSERPMKICCVAIFRTFQFSSFRSDLNLIESRFSFSAPSCLTSRTALDKI